VIVVNDCSHITGISGISYATEIDGGQRVYWMSEDDARALISSPFNVPFLESNKDLLARLGRTPPPSRGIRVTDLLQSIEDQRPRSPFDGAGIVADALSRDGAHPMKQLLGLPTGWVALGRGHFTETLNHDNRET
jgi:hypothetical protein